MRVGQHVWAPGAGWTPRLAGNGAGAADLVLVFGAPAALERSGAAATVRQAHPGAVVAGCSTAGEIAGARVLDDRVTATTIRLDDGSASLCTAELADAGGDSLAVGARLAASLEPSGLRHVLVFSDGLHVNGSALVRGLVAGLGDEVVVTGGLAGDGDRFARTLVVAGGTAAPGRVAAVGLYGDRLRLGAGSMGGWDSFGPDRLITRAEGNVLYELDGRSALELYRTYLGPHADGLPASGLLFPLRLTGEDGEEGVVRTILAVDDENDAMIFAGDLPVGAYARLMHANFDRLVDGAVGAARAGSASLGDGPAELALLISCVGRKLVLGQRVEEEVEAVRDVLGPEAVLTGFYSYGEISPHRAETGCELHNQTMTITTLCEG